MHFKAAALIACAFAAGQMTHATTLPPELKAYDFAEAYVFAHGGVVISPYHHGFYCQGGRKISEGLLLKPGNTFLEYNPDRMFCEEYLFTHQNETQAFFHERIYHYHTVKDAHGKYHYLRDELVDTDDFYLTKDRAMEPFDHVFTDLELHPGSQEWRTRP